jgi:signal transduction histidine kinase
VKRPRWTLRARLTAVYAAVFLGAAAAFLALMVSLVNHNLDTAYKAADNASRLNKASVQPATKPTTPLDDELLRQKFLNANAQTNKVVQSSTTDRLLNQSVLALAVLVPLTALVGWVLAGRALRPVGAITESARRASETQLSDRLALTGPRDEITELADTFDAMLDRLEHAFDAQRRFAADASHELRTPLTVARTAIEVVLAKPQRTPQQLEEMAGDVHTALGRADRVVESLLTLTRSRYLVLRHDQVDLATITEDVLDARSPGIEVETDLRPAPATGDAPLLEQLIGNLVDNAVRHNVAGGRMALRTDRDERGAVLVVTNTGPLVAPALVPTLFEPFQRANGRAGSAEGGLGLGLAIVRSVADAHGATVEAVANPSGGLTVTLLLPGGRPG